MRRACAIRPRFFRRPGAAVRARALCDPVPFQKRSRRLPVKRFDDRTAVAKLNLPFDVDLPKHAGSRPRIQPRENEAYSLAGVVPKVTFSPRNAAETAKVVDAMRHEGAMINIRGAGTKQWRPPAPRGLDAVLDMKRCKGILEHKPRVRRLQSCRLLCARTVSFFPATPSLRRRPRSVACSPHAATGRCASAMDRCAITYSVCEYACLTDRSLLRAQRS